MSCAVGYGASTTCASNFSIQCGPSCAFPNTSCVPIRCSALPVINGVSIYGLINGVPMRGMVNGSGVLNPSGPGLNYGETLNIDCDEGYTVDASTQVSALAKCGAECMFDKTSCVRVSGINDLRMIYVCTHVCIYTYRQRYMREGECHAYMCLHKYEYIRVGRSMN